MKVQSQNEYEHMRSEIIRTQECITDYLKSFFVLGGSVVSAVLVISRFGIATKELSDLIYPSLGFIIIAFSFIVMSFGSLMFHKFITHNRYTGYVQAVSLERNYPEEREGKLPRRIYLWERCIHLIHNDPSLLVSVAEDDEAKREIIKYLNKCDHACKYHNIWGTWNFIGRSFRGAYIVLRAPVNKVDTQSWTFPYFVAFGILVVLGSLIAALVAVIVISITPAVLQGSGKHIVSVEYQVVVQLAFAIYTIICVMGMCNRLYRVCATDGDRTVLYFVYKFALARDKALSLQEFKYDWKVIPPPP